MGPGGAAQHGRPRPHGAAPDADPASTTSAFGYIGRPERAASGEGYPVAHAAEQNRIITTALNVGEAISQYPRKSPASDR